MTNDDRWFEDAGDELRDDEYPDDDVDDDDETATTPCPECGAEVYEDADRCPVCGAYVTHDTNIWSGRPGWWIILGLLGVLATILALAMFSTW